MTGHLNTAVNHINPSKPSGDNVPDMLWICNAGFFLYLWVVYGSDRKQRLFPRTVLTSWSFNAEVWCSLWGTAWILRCYLDQLPLLGVKNIRTCNNTDNTCFGIIKCIQPTWLENNNYHVNITGYVYRYINIENLKCYADKLLQFILRRSFSNKVYSRCSQTLFVCAPPPLNVSRISRPPPPE
jgi:hypothetical protein